MRLGILGGGQLAQMLTQAAISLGLETAIFERKPDSPAARLTHHTWSGDWADDDLLQAFAAACDVITLENEFVDATVLDRLVDLGKPVYPTGQTLRRVQDKLIQKQTMQAAGIPVPPFTPVTGADSVRAFARSYGWPLVLKARRNGYDGYGNATLKSAADVGPALDRFADRDLLVEAFVPFRRELAVMVLRGRDGRQATYPVVETVQKDHICHVVRAPITGGDDALKIAQSAVTAIDGVGVFGVELFERDDGTLLYNEIAPRPHNSGHYTIEACVTSQFENHIRAVMGWPLGETAMVKPCAVMVNVLGGEPGPAPGDAVAPALQVPSAHLHIYAKREIRTGRKMGHVTVLGETLEQAEAHARQAADLVKL
jgi:5-(carboxyamino)imidazole ribonucleotide synthase